MDIIHTAVLAPLAQASAATAPAATAAPNALATARFAELMALPPDASVASHAMQGSGLGTALQSLAPSSPLETNASFGDRILNSIQNVSGELKTSWDSIANTVNTSSNDVLTMHDMFKLQLQLVQTSFQYELVGKAISRSTQNLDQLVRIQ